MGQKELLLIAGMGCENGIGTFEDSLAASYKTKSTLTIQFSDSPSWYLYEQVENVHTHKSCTRICIAALFIIAEA